MRGNDPTLTVMTRFHRDPGFVHSSNTISPSKITSATGTSTDTELPQDGGEADFQQFEIANARIRHVGMNRRLAMPSGTCRGSTARYGYQQS
jgi:hypothetical protein